MSGWYHVESITLKAEQVVFEHAYLRRKAASAHPFDFTAEAHAQKDIPKILVWPPPRAFAVEARGDPRVNLEHPKTILFELSAHENEVLHGTMTVRPGSAGLRLHTAEAQMDESGCRILDSSTPGSISFAGLSSGSKVCIRIPIRLDVDLREIMVRSEVVYATERGKYVGGDSHVIPITLALGVNVQDMFKENALFSKFSISCSTSVPLRILSCQLESSDNFTATTPDIDLGSLIVFPKQPLPVVYRVRRKKEISGQADRQEKLFMQIDYVCLNEEIATAAKDALLRGLQPSSYGNFSRLLAPHLSRELGDKRHAADYEQIGLLREFTLPPYGDLGWDRILAAIQPQQQRSLAAWLERWHETHRTIALPDPPAVPAAAIRHHITIPVDVPTTPNLHTVSLRLHPPSSPAQPYTVGQAIPAELALRHTRVWSADGAAPAGSSAFTYELTAPPDAWLVGGRRRARFEACEGETVRVAVLLLPQRPGRLMLPGVEVHPEPVGPSTAGEALREGGQVDYVSQGEAVLVVPGRRRVGVRVETEAGGEGWTGARMEDV